MPGPFEIEERGLGGGHRNRDVLDTGKKGKVEIAGQQDLPRPDGDQFVHGGVGRGLPAVFRDPELARGQIGGREAEHGGDTLVGSCDRHQERRLARLQSAGIGVRAGGDHPYDFATDDAAGLARVLDLLAHGDPEPLPDQTCKVRVGRMPGHAAHGNLAAASIL